LEPERIETASSLRFRVGADDGRVVVRVQEQVDERLAGLAHWKLADPEFVTAS
jgi:hypothetical protein